MSVSNFRHGDQGRLNDEPAKVVDANMRDADEEEDADEDARMRSGAAEINQGIEILEEVPHLNKAIEILRRRGYTQIVETLSNAEKELVHAGTESMHQGEEIIQHAEEHHRAHQVADLILSEPQQLAAWQGHIQTITTAIARHVPERVFIEAAGGNEVVGRQRREDALRLGDWLAHLEAGAVQTAKEAFQIGIGIVTFVADTETILDHVPGPVKHTIMAALQALFALLPFLR